MILPIPTRKDSMSSAENDQPGDPPSHDPRAKLMQEVAEQMDAIETDFGDNYEIGRVITIVEVKGPDGNVGLRVRAGMFPWVALGMLHAAQKIIEAGGE